MLCSGKLSKISSLCIVVVIVVDVDDDDDDDDDDDNVIMSLLLLLSQLLPKFSTYRRVAKNIINYIIFHRIV